VLSQKPFVPLLGHRKLVLRAIAGASASASAPASSPPAGGGTAGERAGMMPSAGPAVRPMEDLGKVLTGADAAVQGVLDAPGVHEQHATKLWVSLFLRR
jgi:hypothetical protein